MKTFISRGILWHMPKEMAISIPGAELQELETLRKIEGLSRSKFIIEAVNAEGIPCFTGSCSEIYLEKAFDQGHLRPRKRLQVAKVLGDTSLMFLVHPTLSTRHMKITSDIRRTSNEFGVYITNTY